MCTHSPLKRGSKRGAAVAIAMLAVAATRALADTTWQGDETDSWHETFNWTNSEPDANDVAFFTTVASGNSTTPEVFIPGLTQVGGITFLGPAPAFVITVEHTPFPGVLFEIVGAGIVNNSSHTQSISNQGGGSGTDVLAGANTVFRNNATAGNNVVITNFGDTTLGGGGFTTFRETSSAGGAMIVNDAVLNVVTTQGGHTLFSDNSSASNATILNEAGRENGFTQFTTNSSAGNAQITNQGALDPNNNNEAGGTSFGSNTTAANAQIINQGGSGGAEGGGTSFSGNATAGNATITSGGGVGQNSGGGRVAFFGTADAGTASITAGGGAALGGGAVTSFNDNSSAANAALTTNGPSLFGFGGRTEFTGNASGGQAIVITNTGGTFDISGLTTTGMTVGSIDGGGSYVLGNKNLIVGLGLAGAFANTEVSGVISGTNGSLTKTGIGALTLSAPNTYTGGTFLNAGRLSVDDDAALGPGVLQIFGGILGSHVSGTVIPNNITVSGDFAVSPPSGLFAQLKLAGDVNLGAVTRVISPASGNFANFSGRLLGTMTTGVGFQSANSVDGAFILSGSASNTYGGTTTVQGNLLNGGSVQLLLSKTGGATAVPGDLNVNFGGTALLIEDEQIADAAEVAVSFGGNFTVNGHIETITALNGNGSVNLDDGSSAGGRLIVRVGDFDGKITDAGLGGQLVKPGPGTLFLSGANTYTGGTRVEGGILVADNTSGSATGTGMVTVQPGAVLAGGNAAGTSGFIAGPVFIQDMGHLEPGLSPGTLTFQSDLTFAALSQLDYQLGEPGVDGGVNNDLAKVLMDLGLDGELNISPFGFGGAGNYTLLTYGGTLTDNGLAIGTIPPGFDPAQFTIDLSVSGKVILRVVPEPHSTGLLAVGLSALLCRRTAPSLSGAA